MVERLHINVNSNEGKEAVSKVFGIDIEKGKTVEMGKQMAQSAEITMNI